MILRHSGCVVGHATLRQSKQPQWVNQGDDIGLSEWSDRLSRGSLASD
jgi:hypothetical protein